MSTPFRAAHLKIDRANKHIDDLKSAILKLEGKKTSTIQLNSKTGFQELIHAVPELLDIARSDLSLIVGDAVHNLRSALDLAWNTLIDILQNERSIPVESPKKSRKFPVMETRVGVENALNGIKVKTLCPSLFELIVSDIQPYEAGQAGVIFALHNLDISDKHLVLLELRCNASIRGIVVRQKDGEIVHGSGVAIHTDGSYVIPFDVSVEIHDKGELSFAITIEEAGIFKGLEISDLLSGFSQYVSYVVQTLERV